MTKRFDLAHELYDGSRGARWLGLLARVKDDASVAEANAEVERISELMEKQFPEEFRERRAHLATVQEYLTGDMRKPLFIMLGAVALVLLIACANVANLMLVRATAREGEMAIRTALGAGRGRLVRQLITESVLLSLCGAAVGIGVAKLGMHELLGRAPQSLPLVGTASIDGPNARGDGDRRADHRRRVRRAAGDAGRASTISPPRCAPVRAARGRVRRRTARSG